MNKDDFNSSVRKFGGFLEKIKLIDATVYDCALPRSEEFNAICLTSKNYVDIYERGLSLSHYNFLLTDMSYFQFSFSSGNEWALAYYPNPRLSGCPEALEQYRELQEYLETEEINDEEFSELVASLPLRMAVPRFRFEYSESQYKPVNHPSAHFHIGMSGEDRWGTSRKLSPHSFGLAMIRFYHPNYWWHGSGYSLSERDWSEEEYLGSCFDSELVRSLGNDRVARKVEYENMVLHFASVLGAS